MNDEDLSWSDVRDNISRSFGEVPGPALESEIINAFEKNPQAVIKASEEVSAALRAGEIHSGWPILRKRTERITNPLRDVTVPRPDARAKAIARAEQWIKNAGIHYDTASEVEDELFGDRGQLRDWPDLRERFLQTWREARPIGEQLERDLHDRSEHWKATTGVMWTERNRRRLEREADRSTNAEVITQSMPNTDLPAELQPQEPGCRCGNSAEPSASAKSRSPAGKKAAEQGTNRKSSLPTWISYEQSTRNSSDHDHHRRG